MSCMKSPHDTKSKSIYDSWKSKQFLIRGSQTGNGSLLAQPDLAFQLFFFIYSPRRKTLKYRTKINFFLSSDD